MIHVDWTAMMVGLGVGLVMGAVYFAGLALGIRLVLRRKNLVGLLSLSAALRIAALLWVGWVIARQGGPWAALGYAIAFLLARFVATTLARAGADAADVRGASS